MPHQGDFFFNQVREKITFKSTRRESSQLGRVTEGLRWDGHGGRGRGRGAGLRCPSLVHRPGGCRDGAQIHTGSHLSPPSGSVSLCVDFKLLQRYVWRCGPLRGRRRIEVGSKPWPGAHWQRFLTVLCVAHDGRPRTCTQSSSKTAATASKSRM